MHQAMDALPADAECPLSMMRRSASILTVPFEGHLSLLRHFDPQIRPLDAR